MQLTRGEDILAVLLFCPPAPMALLKCDYELSMPAAVRRRRNVIADVPPAAGGGADTVPVRHHVTAGDRAKRTGHAGAVVWLTGLPGSGKSTLAMALERRLTDLGWQAYTLDGDNVRRGLNADLGFSPQDRQENIRRIGEVAALFADAGIVCIAAFISPYREDRAKARAAAGGRHFFEVYVKSGLATCERRDPKGHYKKARAGLLRDFTGVDAPYQVPERPDIAIDTESQDVEASVDELLAFVVPRCRT